MANKATAKRKRVERIIRFPGPLYARLTEVSARNQRSRNAEVLVAVTEYLDREEAKS